MNLLKFPGVILRHIFKFSNAEDYFSARLVCKYFKKYLTKEYFYEIFFLDLSKSEEIIDLPYNLGILKVYDYDQLLKLKLPSSIIKIIIKFLDFGKPNYNLLDVKILSADYLDYMDNVDDDRDLNFKSFKNLKSLHIREIEDLFYFTFPDSLKNICCNNFYIDSDVNLDYLECIDLKVKPTSYIKTIKILKEFNTDEVIEIPRCDTLIVEKKEEIVPEFKFNSNPKIIYL